MALEPNEITYCVCENVATDKMVFCDNPDCPIEWFHSVCVGLISQPTGDWWCPLCSFPYYVPDIPIDPDSPTYCICKKVAYGVMAACYNKNCPVGWFHFGCVGLLSLPEGKWLCPLCSAPEEPSDPHGPTYCICQRVEYGLMIGCDNPNCSVKWFHFGCIGLESIPQEKWLCPLCLPDSDPSKPTYCLCQRVWFGEMVACDNPDCPVEWFHFECVGLTSNPQGEWRCPLCSDVPETCCICEQEPYGYMIVCNNPDCPVQRFHFGCVGLTSSPKEQWFCPQCSSNQNENN